MKEEIRTLLREKIALSVENYQKRKEKNPSGFDDIIGPDVMMTLSSEEQNKIVKMLNTYDKLKK